MNMKNKVRKKTMKETPNENRARQKLQCPPFRIGSWKPRPSTPRQVRYNHNHSHNQKKQEGKSKRLQSL